MSRYIGIEMSDHLSKLYSEPKAKDAVTKRKRRRKIARASRRKNR